MPSTVSVRFRVPYPTLWGQSLAVVGSGPELGDWDVARGVRMTCRAPSSEGAGAGMEMLASNGAGGDGTTSTVAAAAASAASAAATAAASAAASPPRLQPQQQPQSSSSPPPVPVWEAFVELPGDIKTVSYKYLLLSEDGGVARKEATARAVSLPSPFSSFPSSSSSPPAALSALLSDSWLDDAEPGALLGRSAFIDAISPPPGPLAGGEGGGRGGREKGGSGENGGEAGTNPSLSSSAPSLLDAAAAAAAGNSNDDEDSNLPSSPSSQSLHHHHQNNSNHFSAAAATASAAAAAVPREPGSVLLLRLSVRAWDLRPGESLAVLGSAPSLGSWQTARAVRMAPRRREKAKKKTKELDGGDDDENPSSSSSSFSSSPPSSQRPEPPLWELEVSLPAAHFPVTYRFAVLGGGGVGVGNRGSAGSMSNSAANNDPFGGPPLRLEAGENRLVDLDSNSSSSSTSTSASSSASSPAPPLLLVAADGGWLRPPDWRRWRGAGLAVPLFSVRSSKSLGVGGFADVEPLARWCSSAGLRVLQLLPLNDTRVTGDWRDSYPYATLSAFALHPLYCDVEGGLLPEREEEEEEEENDGDGDGDDDGESEKAKASSSSPSSPPLLPPRALAAIKRLREELEPLDAVEYERVLEAKMEAARAVFDASGRAEVGMRPLVPLSSSSALISSSSSRTPPRPTPSPSFAAFYAENAHWLRPHAAHRILSTKVFGHSEHWRWGSLSSSKREGEGEGEGEGEEDSAAAAVEKDLERVLSLGSEEKEESPSSSSSSYPFSSASPDALFEWWLQWKLHLQLLKASQVAAQEYGVALKGDLPIGVDACGVDAWHRPELFRLGKGSTGAPPDAFDARGQAWGFPTYDWDAAASEHFEWWRSRLSRMSIFFHALRIDHVLGFFRIWELEPGAVTGACGRFRPAKPVSRQELLETAGLWDIDRLTHPHVTRELAAKALAPAVSVAVAAAASSSSSVPVSPLASSSPSSPSSTAAAPSRDLLDALIDRFLEPVPGVPGRLRFRARFDSEAAIDALGRRADGKVKDFELASSSSSGSPSPSGSVDLELLRLGLLSLRQNVCLIEDPDLFDDGGAAEEEKKEKEKEEGSSEQQQQQQAMTAANATPSSSSPPPRHPNARPLLHPRFNLTQTTSFCDLGPQGWRDALARLHEDYYYGEGDIYFLSFFHDSGFFLEVARKKRNSHS